MSKVMRMTPVSPPSVRRHNLKMCIILKFLSSKCGARGVHATPYRSLLANSEAYQSMLERKKHQVRRVKKTDCPAVESKKANLAKNNTIFATCLDRAKQTVFSVPETHSKTDLAILHFYCRMVSDAMGRFSRLLRKVQFSILSHLQC